MQRLCGVFAAVERMRKAEFLPGMVCFRGDGCVILCPGIRCRNADLWRLQGIVKVRAAGGFMLPDLARLGRTWPDSARTCFGRSNNHVGCMDSFGSDGRSSRWGILGLAGKEKGCL